MSWSLNVTCRDALAYNSNSERLNLCASARAPSTARRLDDYFDNIKLLTNAYKRAPHQNHIIMSSHRINLNCSRPRLSRIIAIPLRSAQGAAGARSETSPILCAEGSNLPSKRVRWCESKTVSI